jgi:hypothetical protein
VPAVDLFGLIDGPPQANPFFDLLRAVSIDEKNIMIELAAISPSRWNVSYVFFPNAPVPAPVLRTLFCPPENANSSNVHNQTREC